MSTADGSDLTVPDDDDELLAELRHHRVSPGRRLHISVLSSDRDQVQDQESTPRRVGFIGSIDAEPDLSEKTDEYLSGFGLE
jgi:hypothetical protein